MANIHGIFFFRKYHVKSLLSREIPMKIFHHVYVRSSREIFDVNLTAEFKGNLQHEFHMHRPTKLNI